MGLFCLFTEGNRIMYERLGYGNGTTTTTTPDPYYGSNNNYDGGSGYPIGMGNLPNKFPSAFNNRHDMMYKNLSCGRNMYMGNIVDSAAPYLFPVVIEYSLIAAAVAFIIWRNIGRGVQPKQ